MAEKLIYVTVEPGEGVDGAIQLINGDAREAYHSVPGDVVEADIYKLVRRVRISHSESYSEENTK